jgi:Undecaprenyl-phosphate glucose phosphotransferase
MIRRLSLYEFFFRIVCFLLPAADFAAAGLVLRSANLILPLSRDYLYLGLTITLIWAICALHFEVTNVETLFQAATGVRNSLKAVLWTYMSAFSVLFFYRSGSYSRMLLAASGVLLFVSVLVLRAAFRQIVRLTGTQAQLRAIVVGADAFALSTAERLSRSEVTPCQTVAFVRLPGQQVSVTGDIPVFELEQVVRQNLRHFADDIVIAASPETLPVLAGLIHQLRALAIPIRFCLDFGSDVRVRERFFRLGEAQLLDVEIAPAETISYVVLKRCFDVTFSILALLIAGLPMLVIAALIKLSSPGPVLFAQERIGINGQVFRMIKFRTMQVSDTEQSDTRWTTAGDARRTGLGAFLRRSSLDELPQFFNVLRGEMSVVGPRPERPYFVEKFNDEIDAYNVRHHLKSGITGWAQVNGLRGDTDIAKRVELDMYYIENWSFIFDLQIIAMTLVSGFFAENAY